MIDNALVREMLAQHHARDLMREAERDRLVRLAASGRKADGTPGAGFWTRVRRFLTPAGIGGRPSVNAAG